MVERRGSIAVAALLALAGAAGAGEPPSQRADPAQPSITPIVLGVLAQPVAVRGSDRRRHVVYELELRNVASVDAKIERVEIRDGDRDRVLRSLSRAEVVERSKRDREEAAATVLGPRQFAILHLHLEFEGEADLPRRLVHRAEAELDAAERVVAQGGETAVSTRPVPVLGPPLRGRRYIAGDGCCDSTRHVRALLPLNGRLWLAQRYAVDWEQLDEEGRIFAGDSGRLESYHVYGDPVLTVADGEVAMAVDRLPDVPPGRLPDLDVADADGNHVILDIGDGLYVLYAHLQPGSVALSAGDRVTRGQVLGRVGNSGNTLEPHLHLQVVDAPSALLANGVPYVFDRFAITGVDREGTADFDRATKTGEPAAITPVAPPTRHERELPLDLSVVDWLNE